MTSPSEKAPATATVEPLVDANTPKASGELEKLDTLDKPLDVSGGHVNITINTTVSNSTDRPSMETATVPASSIVMPCMTQDASTPASARRNPFETDMEAMITHSTSRVSRLMGDHMEDSDSRVWPGQKHWKKKAKEAKMKRSCTCLSRLNKRNRLIAKMLIGLLIIGIAVGVGVGISKPLGAGIWKPSS